MDLNELKDKILPCLEQAIIFSFSNGLNIHTSIGGKYAELFVAAELWELEPKLAGERKSVKSVKNPGSCDEVLAKTGKKLEIKWSMLHHRQDDPFVKGSQGIPFWNWGFSSGKQFIEGKFDYCVLLAAEKDKALPRHIFVIKLEEMTEKEMDGQRKSVVYSKGSFFIEFSPDCDFYCKRKWCPKGPSPLEEKLCKNKEKYEERWSDLKQKGKLASHENCDNKNKEI
jgi:hypothetical protein